MSERQYETGFFLGKVWDVSYRGFPTPPLLLALHLCKELVAFLKRDEKNVGVVHCFRGFARTSLFLAMFIAYFSSIIFRFRTRTYFLSTYFNLTYGV